MTVPLRPLLVVDDDAENLELTKLLLSRARIQNPVITARGGEEAEDILRRCCEASGARRSSKPVLVLLDLNMPGISGLEVLQWLRRQPALGDVKVVVWTSSMDENDERRARELKADAYLLKFPNAAILGAVVRGCVQSDRPCS